MSKRFTSLRDQVVITALGQRKLNDCMLENILNSIKVHNRPVKFDMALARKNLLSQSLLSTSGLINYIYQIKDGTYVGRYKHHGTIYHVKKDSLCDYWYVVERMTA